MATPALDNIDRKLTRDFEGPVRSAFAAMPGGCAIDADPVRRLQPRPPHRRVFLHQVFQALAR